MKDDQDVASILLARGNSPEKNICISGEDVNGVHCRYSREYMRWNLHSLAASVSVHLSDTQREAWFVSNPAPLNKFKEP
jgi:hypothetical protein